MWHENFHQQDRSLVGYRQLTSPPRNARHSSIVISTNPLVVLVSKVGTWYDAAVSGCLTVAEVDVNLSGRGHPNEVQKATPELPLIKPNDQHSGIDNREYLAMVWRTHEGEVLDVRWRQYQTHPVIALVTTLEGQLNRCLGTVLEWERGHANRPDYGHHKWTQYAQFVGEGTNECALFDVQGGTSVRYSGDGDPADGSFYHKASDSVFWEHQREAPSYEPPVEIFSKPVRLYDVEEWLAKTAIRFSSVENLRKIHEACDFMAQLHQIGADRSESPSEAHDLALKALEVENFIYKLRRWNSEHNPPRGSRWAKSKRNR
jgi:hypothetical protein